MELGELMKDCLIHAHKDYPDYDYIDTVMAAFASYVNIIGNPVEFVDDEEAEEYLKRCVGFLVDCVLLDMVEKGICEVEGMEDGEFVYKITAEF